MAVSAKIRIQGIEKLKERLLAKRESMVKVLNMRLAQLAEEAIVHAKTNKGYKDRTANLKNSISYALYLDGEPVIIHANEIPQKDAVKNNNLSVEEHLKQYAAENVRPQGYSLVIVAGMEYAPYVEHKGYNVLYLTKFFIQDELKKILKESISIITNK